MTYSHHLSQPAMTKGNVHLVGILQKYQARDTIYHTSNILTLKQTLRNWASTSLIDIAESGSRAKGTAISLGSDIDYLVSLINGTSDANGGLKGIHDSLFSYLKQIYPSARKQNVSVRITLGTFGNQLEVDITPAQKHAGNTNSHSLYVSKSNKAWTQTNIQRHIYDVSTSGRVNEIKLLKVWREINRIDFPSAYMEYLLINNILLNRSKNLNELENNFFYVLKELSKDSGNPLFSRVVDPANSTNILSDLLNYTEKNKIISAAKQSVSKKFWEEIVY